MQFQRSRLGARPDQRKPEFDRTVVMVQATADGLDKSDVDESSGPVDAFEDDSSWDDEATPVRGVTRRKT